jgi:hypothetical protein
MFNEGKEQAEQADGIERLRLILEREHRRPVSFEEAQEVGESLISFYEVLGSQMEDSEQLQSAV